MKKVVSLLLALLLVLSLAACGEQKTPDNSDPGTENTLNYPASPITLYCPWAAGGSSDLMCRQISSLLGKYADNAIVNVVNREGATARSAWVRSHRPAATTTATPCPSLPTQRFPSIPTARSGRTCLNGPGPSSKTSSACCATALSP